MILEVALYTTCGCKAWRGDKVFLNQVRPSVILHDREHLSPCMSRRTYVLGQVDDSFFFSPNYNIIGDVSLHSLRSKPNPWLAQPIYFLTKWLKHSPPTHNIHSFSFILHLSTHQHLPPPLVTSMRVITQAPSKGALKQASILILFRISWL